MTNTKEFFAYSTGRTTVANTGVGVKTSILINEGDFEVEKITGIATYPATATVLLQVTSQNKLLMNIAVPFGDLVGTAQLPSYIKNLRLKQNTQLDVTFTNAGAGSDTMSITLLGSKIS